jgi:hypothetical protein
MINFVVIFKIVTFSFKIESKGDFKEGKINGTQINKVNNRVAARFSAYGPTLV